MANHAPDSSPVAAAIDRILEAECAMAAAIAAAQVEADARLEAARERRRQILDRARERSIALHERAQAQLERRLLALEAEARPDDDTARRDLGRLATQAVERLARSLTTDAAG